MQYFLKKYEDNRLFLIALFVVLILCFITPDNPDNLEMCEIKNYKTRFEETIEGSTRVDKSAKKFEADFKANLADNENVIIVKTPTKERFSAMVPIDNQIFFVLQYKNNGWSENYYVVQKTYYAYLNNPTGGLATYTEEYTVKDSCGNKLKITDFDLFEARSISKCN